MQVETTGLGWTDDARRIGAELRAHRKALGITMTAAAEVAGISRITWHRLEKGVPGVSWGALLAAVRAAGLELQLAGAEEAGGGADPLALAALPLSIALSEFPGLRRLAWQIGTRVDALTPREAAGLYARNARHLDVAALNEREKRLMRALRQVIDTEVPDV